MKRDERLIWLAREIDTLRGAEKGAKEALKELTEEFHRLIRDVHKNTILPVRTVEVPDEFFTSTDMNFEEFADSRFPGWEVEHVERNIALHKVVFVLRRDPNCMPDSVDIAGVRVSKVVSEYSPEIDWDTLQKEAPGLFDKLAEPVLQYEVNEEALERLMNETPEELAILQRHMKVKKPALKVTTRKVKDG